METSMLQPVIALVLWSFVMWAWLYATRIPAILRLKVPMDPRHTQAQFSDAFPPEVRWKADNYNHLMEQPTLFYAVALSLAIMGQGEAHVVNLTLAWAYVALRVIHSLIQATGLVIVMRFGVFMVSSLVLLALTVHAAMAAF